ncbi:Myb family transcription factor APL [Vitis vinifera]|uniref:Myb family transcription factor APL n=1 Tax=Vitis vinifera TaxID=29760 RepID=A0A438J3P3_VITVI|nr:Myb family transcription factor APL [Vitis vinifera]
MYLKAWGFGLPATFDRWWIGCFNTSIIELLSECCLKKYPTMHSHDRPLSAQGTLGLSSQQIQNPGSVGPLSFMSEATPKTIMRVMGVKGLTLYHLKSHLQLGKQPHKDFNDQAVKDGEKAASALGNQEMLPPRLSNGSQHNENMHFNEALRMQMEVRRRLNEQLEVQRHLQMRIDAQGKYMQTILEKACQTLTGKTETVKATMVLQSPIIWSNDMQLLQEVGTAAACIPSQEDAFKSYLKQHHEEESSGSGEA